MSWRPLVFSGTLAYGIYLFHVFAIDVVGFAIPVGQTNNPLLATIRVLLACAIAFVVALLLHKFFKKPLIALERKITSRDSAPGTMPADKSAPQRERAT